MDFSPLPAAEELFAARMARRIVAPLAADIVPRNRADGAAVQRALAARMRADPPAGFKIGATAQTMRTYLGIETPIAGFMPASSLYETGAAVPFGGLVKPGVECELAVWLARDLPPGPCDMARAAQAVGAFLAAIEVVENRYGDLTELGAPTLLADQMFHAAAVLGSSLPDWQALDLPALSGTVSVNGMVRGTGRGADLMGHPLHALAMLAESEVAEAFGGLRKGQVVLLGSVTPPIWLDGPAEVAVDFHPLPTVRVRLT
jgi:2-keto-4-pentenoate hydratase